MTRTAKQPAKKRKTVKMKTWLGWCAIDKDGNPSRMFAWKYEARRFCSFVLMSGRIARVEVREIVTKRSKA